MSTKKNKIVREYEYLCWAYQLGAPVVEEESERIIAAYWRLMDARSLLRSNTK